MKLNCWFVLRPLEPELNDGRLPFNVWLAVAVWAAPPLLVHVTVLLVPILTASAEGLNPQFGGVTGVHVGFPSKIDTGVPVPVDGGGRVR